MAEQEEERAWVQKSQKGDHEAFESLVKCYQRMIHALTFRMTGSMADAEDLAQETFIQAFRQIGSYQGRARFSTWLYRIAVNLCLNWQKKRQRLDRLHDDFGKHQENIGTDHRRAQMVQDALLKLKPKQRAAVALTVYEGLNHAEAARVLGCSETTVSWRLFAARARLKKLLCDFQKDTPNGRL